MISFRKVISNGLPSNMFNIKTDMMHWLSDAGQVPMNLLEVTGQTDQIYHNTSLSLCEFTR